MVWCLRSRRPTTAREVEERLHRAAAASRARVVGSRSSAIVGSIQPVGLLVGEGEGKGGHRGSGADSWPEGLQAERTLKQHNQASSSSTYSLKDERVVMGTRVVERLRESGIEVSKENERLVCDHFRSLPKRYGIAVKDALSEILMHISLLEDSRQRNGQIAHCLRAVVAKLPLFLPVARRGDGGDFGLGCLGEVVGSVDCH